MVSGKQSVEERSVTRTEARKIIIRPTSGWAALNLRDLWVYRELVYFMTWRDLKVRYKQTALGAAWAILQPFLTMVVFSIFFGNLAGVPSDGVPYPIFSYTALIPWTLFSKALQDASRSLVNSSHMITKVYFPRMILPLASVLAGIVDFLIAFVVLLAMMAFYHVVPTANIWTIPLFLILALITATGVSLWLSALNVLYRDINYVLPFLTQFWMYITPIAYPSSMVPEKWRLLYAVNPMTGVVEGFRWALLGSGEAPGMMTLVSTLVAIVLLVSGMFYFKRMERLFADMV
ncbi:ABC transporter permease [Pelolinea submarina]|uniref:Transport permease protein n=1 Tax=Pelolinea submarina TaxID=913107 RepID=A0A347ZVW0_9CHLR|nr:ABC transporter permease [Pelolinea submarina]REG07137.1 lipopolysaccharide transport system permease protein [Pelolinea submarina]BBB49441.1 lipopolysaccharide transport system permease protein [Pelolinea submarina]